MANKIKSLSSFDGDLINMIRKEFKKEYLENSQYYLANDYDKIMNKPFWIFRYTNVDENISHAKLYARIKEALRWRKTMDLENFNQSYLPKEIYQVGGIFINKSNKDNAIIYIRGKVHRKLGVFQDRLKYFFAHLINFVDNYYQKPSSFIIVLDASGSCIANTDFDMLMFIFKVLRDYFPMACEKVYINGLPWILNGFSSLILSILPSDSVKKIVFCNTSELKNEIAEENLPDFLDGKCNKNYRRVPYDAKEINLFSKELDMDVDELQNLIKPFKKFIEPEKCEVVANYFEIL